MNQTEHQWVWMGSGKQNSESKLEREQHAPRRAEWHRKPYGTKGPHGAAKWHLPHTAAGCHMGGYLRGKVQWRVTIVVSSPYCSAVFQQQAHNIDVAILWWQASGGTHAATCRNTLSCNCCWGGCSFTSFAVGVATAALPVT